MTDKFQKAFPVSWDQLHRDAKALAWRLTEAGSWRSVIAITRGGLVPAAIVARELEVRLIDTVCVSSYEHQDQGELQVLKPVSDDREGEGMLIVDDLVATGGTACAAVQLVRQAGAEVVGASFVIDLPDLGGREKLAAMDVPVRTLISFEGG